MEGDKEKIWLVIDANIVFSALIKDDSLTGKIIFSDRFSLFFPEDGLIELNKYESYILKKRSNYKQKLSYDYLLSCIFEVVEVVPSKYYEDKIKEAYEIMKNIDEKDTPYVSLALKLNCPIWSNDTDLKKQNKIKVYNTKELLEEFKNLK